MHYGKNLISVFQELFARINKISFWHSDLIMGRLAASNHSRRIWGWLLFSCGVAHCEGSIISVFQEFLASIDKIFILVGGPGGPGGRAIILWG